MRAFYKGFGSRMLCGWFKFLLWKKKKPVVTVGRSLLLKDNEDFKVGNIYQGRRYWKYFPKKVISNNVFNEFVKISFSLLLNKSNWCFSRRSSVRRRFYISWRIPIIYTTAFSKSWFYQKYTVSAFLRQQCTHKCRWWH